MTWSTQAIGTVPVLLSGICVPSGWKFILHWSMGQHTVPKLGKMSWKICGTIRRLRNLKIIIIIYHIYGGTRWRTWLRHCATSRKVAGSIPDGDIILPVSLWPWGLTQPLTEMRTMNISWGGGGKGGRYVRLTTLPPSRADCLEIWELQTPGTLRVCAGP
jgi:hypothetical protein